ncbi:MAG: hypothetical protein AAGF83_00555 [Cyanobacteria bacterium P01_G01_bin.67]
MKKSNLALLTAVIAFAPLAAFAQDSSTSIQHNTNSAAAVGTANFIDQDATQTNIQQQLDIGGYGYTTPEAQTSAQINANEAAAIGNYNVIDQDATQTNIQDQVDLNHYLPQSYGY